MIRRLAVRELDHVRPPSPLDPASRLRRPGNKVPPRRPEGVLHVQQRVRAPPRVLDAASVRREGETGRRVDERTP